MKFINYINQLLNSPIGSEERKLGVVIGLVAIFIAALILIIIICGINNYILSPWQSRIRERKAKRENREKLFVGVSQLIITLDQVEEIRLKKIDPLDKIVEFYAVTSILHDAKVFSGVDAFMLEENEREVMRECVSVIAYIGRHPYGYNRTRPGQPVTKGEVFLGNTHGIYTNSVRVWQKTHQEGGLTGLHENTYTILQNQATTIMNGGVQILQNAVEAYRKLRNGQQHC